MKLLLKSGADINKIVIIQPSKMPNVEYDMNNIDHYWQQDRDIKLLKALLLHGADVKTANLAFIKENCTVTPLEMAVTIAVRRNYMYKMFDRMKNYVFLLYVAGAFHTLNQLADSTTKNMFTPMWPDHYRESFFIKVKEMVQKVFQNDNHQGTLLINLCRREIRAHLLRPTGGNNKNLIHSVLRLPLPGKLKKFLLFDLDTSEWENSA